MRRFAIRFGLLLSAALFSLLLAAFGLRAIGPASISRAAGESRPAACSSDGSTRTPVREPCPTSPGRRGKSVPSSRHGTAINNAGYRRGRALRRGARPYSGIPLDDGAASALTSSIQRSAKSNACAIERLEALGYLSGSKEVDERGVKIHVKEKVYRGWNFYTSGHAPEALLIDMDGRELHRWRFDFWDAWPNYPIKKDHFTTEFWRRAYLYPNGDILAVFEGLGIIKLDKDSNLIWANPLRAHHDLEVLDNGDIYLLSREAHMVPRVHPSEPVLEDFISLLDANGNEELRFSVLEAVERSEFPDLLRRSRGRSGDLYHTNTIHVLDGRIAKREPAFKRGNLLLHLLKIHATIVVDPNERKVVWVKDGDPKGGQRFQHDPKILANGNLMIFTNVAGGMKSRVDEFEGVGQAVAWKYGGTEKEFFYSYTCGTAERLPNGNTLITSSDDGRAFEVTRENEIVWEFYNPHRAGTEGQFIATLFEVVRIPPEFPVQWAQKQLDIDS